MAGGGPVGVPPGPGGALDVGFSPCSRTSQAGANESGNRRIILSRPCQGGYLYTLAGGLGSSRIARPIPPGLTLRNNTEDRTSPFTRQSHMTSFNEGLNDVEWSG